jgi:HTH-type transcriptional regulator, sugar sensing transcriptional regulator
MSQHNTDNSDIDLDTNEDKQKFNEINKDLQKLGFTINDSKIYITLLEIGLSSPAKISEKSHVDRARVYDSLKRLVKKEIVEEEPVLRAPRYRAIHPSKVFGRIRRNYNSRITLSQNLEKKLQTIKLISKEQNSVWAIQGANKVKKKNTQFLENAEKFFYTIITPEFYTFRELQTFTEHLITKREKNQDLDIRIAFKISKDEQEIKILINRLYHANIDIFNWNGAPILPFGLTLTEQAFIQIFLNSTVPRPKYEFGIFMDKCSLEQAKGFKHLCLWVFTNLCQKVIFQKKSKKTNDD